MFDKLTSIFSRVAFFIASLLLLIAVWNWFIQLLGWRLLWNYTSGRLLEFSAIFMVFVIVLLLRQIRDTIKTQNTKS